jgi:hypothetical protein
VIDDQSLERLAKVLNEISAAKHTGQVLLNFHEGRLISAEQKVKFEIYVKETIR